jgi:hypothetical protein
MPAIFRYFGFYSRRICFMSLILLGVLFLVDLTANGQMANSDGAPALRLNEVNSHAARHFLNHYSYATGVKWIRDDHYYIACFESDQSRTRVNYDNDGNFAFSVKYYTADGLSGDLKMAIAKKFPGCQLRIVTEWINELYKKAIFVNIQDGHYIRTIRCDEEGIEVTENIENAGI